MPKHARNLPLAQEIPPESPPNQQKRCSNYDETAILIASQYPELSNNQIGKKIKDLGLAKNHKTIHDRWRKSDYLRREITEVRNHNIQEIQREHVPKALKKLKKQLNNKNDNIQMRAINMSLKYGMGEMVNAPEGGVAIHTIENAQIIIEANSGRKGSSESVKNDPED